MHTSVVQPPFYMHPYAFAGCANVEPAISGKRSYAQQIIKTVCKHQGITEEQINTRTRKRDIVYARHLAIYLIRQHTKLGLKDIGLQFGDLMLDHTTIIHSIQTINNWMDTDLDVKRTVQLLMIKTQFANHNS